MNEQIFEQCKDLKCVIFDLDGTLFHSELSFDSLRETLGLASSESLLEYIQTLETKRQQKYHKAICQIEQNFAKSGRLHPTFPKLLEFFSEQDISLAIWTRNSQKATEISLGKHLEAFEIICTRENARAKPHPQGLYNILKQCKCDLDQALFVGDSKFDLEAAQISGINACIINSQLGNNSSSYEHIGFIAGLEELLNYLR